MAKPQDTQFVRKRAPALTAIITLKAGKAILLLALGLGFFSLIGQDLDARFDALLRFIHIDPDKHFWFELGNRLQKITPANLRWLGSGSLLYSLLLLTESIGLIRRSWWAVWLAIGETAFFIPIEVHDLVEHFTWVVTVILSLNVVIVAYLVRNRDRLFRHHHPHPKDDGRDDAPAAEI
jgi:uncharacterized membrane protein (DUF2068 family)